MIIGAKPEADVVRTKTGMYRVAGLLLSASAIRYAGQLTLLVLIAWSAGVTGVGTYTVALAICAPIYILAGFGIRTVRLTLHRAVAPHTYERFLLTSLLTAYALVAVISIILPPEIGRVLLLIAVIRTGETFADLYNAMFQRGGRPGTLVAVVAGGTGLQVVAVAVAFARGGSLVPALLLSAGAYALVVLCVTRPLAHRAEAGTASAAVSTAIPTAGASDERRDWSALFAAGLPTGIAIGTITLLSTVPQYLLGWTGVEDAGRFAVFLYVVVAVEVLLHALAQSWIPHARTMLDNARLTPAAVGRTAARWMLIASVPGLLGLAAAAVLLPRVLGPEFALTPALMLPLACAVLLVPGAFAADTALVVRNRYRLSMGVSLSALLVGSIVGTVLVAVDAFDLPTALWLFTGTMAARAASGFAAVVLASQLGPRPKTQLGPRRGVAGLRLRFRTPDVRGVAERFWPVLPIAVAAFVMVAAGPRWVLGVAGAIVLVVVLTLVRTRSAELLVMTVPLAVYASIGGVRVNLAVSDVLLLLLLIRIILDPDCARAFADVSSRVRGALCILAILPAFTAVTIMMRSTAGAPVDWITFVADVVKLVVVLGYFIVCIVVFRDLLLRRDFRFLTVWTWTAAAVGALGVLGYLLYEAGVPNGLAMDFRATSTFEDPNAFATYLIMSLPIAILSRYVTGRSLLSWHQIPILAGVIASFSRGALVGLAAVVLVLCFLAFRDPALRALRFIALIAVVVVALLVVQGAANSLFESGRGVGFGEDVRFRLWAAAVEVWLHAPLFGVGLGQFVISSEDLLGSAGGVLAHNTYLSVLAEGGVVGTLLYFAVPAAAAGALLKHRGGGSAIAGDPALSAAAPLPGASPLPGIAPLPDLATVMRLLLASGVGGAVMAVSLNLQNYRPLWLFFALVLAWTATRNDAPIALDRQSPAHPPNARLNARTEAPWN